MFGARTGIHPRLSGVEAVLLCVGYITLFDFESAHAVLCDEGEQMELGLPLSDQHGLNTYKDHLESGRTLFNVVLLCKWHPPPQMGPSDVGGPAATPLWSRKTS